MKEEKITDVHCHLSIILYSLEANSIGGNHWIGRGRVSKKQIVSATCTDISGFRMISENAHTLNKNYYSSLFRTERYREVVNIRQTVETCALVCLRKCQKTPRPYGGIVQVTKTNETFDVKFLSMLERLHHTVACSIVTLYHWRLYIRNSNNGESRLIVRQQWYGPNVQVTILGFHGWGVDHYWVIKKNGLMLEQTKVALSIQEKTKC